MKNSIFIIVFLGTLFTPLSAQEKTNFSLEDIFKNGTFAAKGASSFDVLNDGISYAVLTSPGKDDWKLSRVNLATGKDTQEIFTSVGVPTKIFPESYTFSKDENYLIVTTVSEKIYRHSSKSLAYVVDIKLRTITQIGSEKIMYPTLSPDNKSVAFVKENNLYIFDISTGNIQAITSDGKRNQIINGGVDWVYEEEFSMSQGFEWSPDSRHIAFFRFDESKVKEFSMTMFGGLYPSEEKWKYPKAGEDNSVVDVYIYSVQKNKSSRCNFPSGDQYFPRLKWTNEPGILSIQHLNRLQNEWTLFFGNADNGLIWEILSEKNAKFIAINDNLNFIKNKNCFVYTSEKNGYNHIYLYDYKDKSGTSKSVQEMRITNGNWDVLNINGIDEKAGIIYYTSSEISATEDHFYSIHFDGKKKTHLTPQIGNHTIALGKGNQYYTDITSTINTPNRFILKKIGSNWHRDLELNTDLIDKLSKYNFGSTEFGKMAVRAGDTLNYYIMKPWNFDASKKYPVLMYVYGGPGANTVRNSYGGRNYLWHQLLTESGYLVVSVDGRGTGHRGEQFAKSTYLQLGKLELEDQTDAAKWLGEQSWVDASRIGIWGWSFGGYMSSNCLAKSSTVFKTAIAVAPVTNWRYYDNIYTERYMRTPKENGDGYDQNSPINFVAGIKGNFLLIHGTGDDNVHFQNSIEMVNAMIKAGVKYDSEYYPNRNHGIGDRAAQYHLYRRMTDYLLEKL